MLHSGASERTIPAQAVPWPQRSPSASSATATSSSSRATATAPSSSPTSGWPASTPLSRMQTRTPLPVAPPQAQSRVTCSGQSPIEIFFAASAGMLQAGRLSSIGGSYLLGDAAAKLLEERAGGLDALRPQSGLEVGDDALPEGLVGLGALDDRFQLPAGTRQLLRRLHPGRRGRWKHPDETGKLFDVEYVLHHVTCSQDGGRALFLPSARVISSGSARSGSRSCR